MKKKFTITVASLNDRDQLQVPSPKTGKTLAGVTSSLNDVVDCIGLSLGVDDKTEEAMEKLLEVAKKADVAIDSAVIVKGCDARGLEVFDKITKTLVVFDYETAKADMSSGTQSAQKRVYDRIRQKIKRINAVISGDDDGTPLTPLEKMIKKLASLSIAELDKVIKAAQKAKKEKKEKK